MTRNNLPESVDPNTLAIAEATAQLEGDLRRMGMGLQADRAKAIHSAAQTLVERQRAVMREALGLASPND